MLETTVDSEDEVILEDITDFSNRSNLVSLDCQAASTSEDILEEKKIELITVDHSYTQPSTYKELDWCKYTPDMLRKQISSPLRAGPKKASTNDKENGVSFKKQSNPISSKMVEWSAKKIELAEVQQSAFAEEHQLKLKHMQEKHEQMMLLMQNESAEKMMFTRKEHEMNMLILEAKLRSLNT